jgi:hypothetical protein
MQIVQCQKWKEANTGHLARALNPYVRNPSSKIMDIPQIGCGYLVTTGTIRISQVLQISALLSESKGTSLSHTTSGPLCE